MFSEELRGFESRCCRLQNSYDRLQTERLQFLRTLATIVGVNEPCENNIRDKVREITNHNQSLHDVSTGRCIILERSLNLSVVNFQQTAQLKEQLHQEASRHREHQERTTCQLKTEEQHRLSVEERLEKACHELQHFRSEHVTVSFFYY